MSCWKPIKISFDVTEPSSGSDESLPPIILLHGMTHCKLNWTGIDQPLADSTKRKVYKLDARNHGYSDWSGDLSYDFLAKDVNYFMEQNKIPKAILIGHSMGGGTAMKVAANYPEKIEKIIIEDMINESLDPSFQKELLDLLQYYETFLDSLPKDTDLPTAASKFKEAILSIMPEKYKSEKTAETFDASHNLRKTDNGIVWNANLKTIRKMVGNIIGGFEAFYDGDSLFVYGTESILRVIDHKDSILKKFPKAIFKPVEHAAHELHAEFPDEFLRILKDFIKQD